MEFHEKLQELRKQKGLTQEELAARLYVSRTAISKWESGRGYPNLDSLKAIAKFFSVTLDELLSTDEVLTIAEKEQQKTQKVFFDLTYGLLDLSMSLLLFLPFFAARGSETIRGASLFMLGGIQPYLKIAYLAIVVGMALFGIFTLALQNCGATAWLKSKTNISLASGAISVLLFMISLQPYAAVFALTLLAIKVFLLIKRR